jgi:hypothetical protein
MGGSYPIGGSEIEKNDGIPKLVDHPSKPYGENFQGIVPES